MSGKIVFGNINPETLLLVILLAVQLGFLTPDCIADVPFVQKREDPGIIWYVLVVKSNKLELSLQGLHLAQVFVLGRLLTNDGDASLQSVKRVQDCIEAEIVGKFYATLSDLLAIPVTVKTNA